MAGLGLPWRLWVRAVSKGSAVPTGPGVCPRVAPLGFSLKFLYLTQESMGQNCSRMDGWIVVRLLGLEIGD